jgi:FMN-dependent NADH-azoreductase
MEVPMKLLHIDASVNGAESASRQLTAAAVAQLRKANPGLALTYRDLVAQPLTHIEGRVGENPVVEEFLAADTVVIGAPMYNFAIPSQLKAWIDHILVAGKTFSYDANGPKGLATGKQVIIAVSRGGKYGAETPMAAFEHVESYLRGVFGFIGITPQFIVAEGLMMGSDQRATAITAALESVAALKAA